MDSKRNQKLRQAREKLDRRIARSKSESLDVSISSAIKELNQGNFDRCVEQCDVLIGSNRSTVAAYMLKGRAWLTSGDIANAIHTIKSAIDSGLNDANLWCELGNLHSENGDHNNAVDAWKSSLERDPNNQAAKKNLGFSYFEANELGESETHLVSALANEPSDLSIVRTLATVWIKQERFQIAAELLEKSIQDHPYEASSFKLLSTVYRSAGQIEEYQSVLRRWLTADPDNAIAKHMIAGASDDSSVTPQRASDQYIREVFDQFAESFDADLEQLHYEAPEHVARAMRLAFGVSESLNRDLTILDAGCGTGVCAAALRPYAKSLVGVDLSSRMVKIAEDRRQYDQLEVAELTDFLSRHQNEFDLIIGCDTFNYFGDLRELWSACHNALKQKGMLIVTLEHGNESTCDDFRLNMNGRYTHSQAYVSQSAIESKLQVLNLEHVTLRQEAGEPVAGLLITLQKLA